MEVLANTLIRPGLRLQQLTIEDLLITSTIYFRVQGSLLFFND